MVPGRQRFLAFVLAAAHLLAFVNASTLTRVEAQEHAPLVGQLLIASPRMANSMFSQTVILMVRHEAKGAMGIIINRPIGDRPLASLLEASGDKTTEATGKNVRVYGGGPVEPRVGFVVHTGDYQSPQTVRIDDRIAVTSSLDVLRDISSERGPKKSLLAFGYAGWGPGQLETEFKEGLWFTTTDDPKLIFDLSPDEIWEEALKRRTQDL